MDRYAKTGEEPPELLYTDRDCCCDHGPSKFQELFSGWSTLRIRLDVWHYMSRLACGVSSESHPLYGPFIVRLSGCIFEWDMEDYDLLLRAKKGELATAGIPKPSDSAARKAITKDELARHCRRRLMKHHMRL